MLRAEVRRPAGYGKIVKNIGRCESESEIDFSRKMHSDFAMLSRRSALLPLLAAAMRPARHQGAPQLLCIKFTRKEPTSLPANVLKEI